MYPSYGSANTKPSAEFFQQKKLEAHQHKIADFSLRLFGIFWFGLLFVGLYWLIPTGILSNPVTFDALGWSIVIGFIILLGVIFYIANFLGAISWLYVMQRYLPEKLLREFLGRVGISEPLMNWAVNKILR